jgi:serine palmitoyltransferase
MNPTSVLPNVYVLGYKLGQSLSKVMNNGESILPSPREILSAVTSFPVWYKEWWWHLFLNDPVHVIVETTLLVAIVYFLVSRRSQDWRELNREKLTPQEEEDLLYEWKTFGRKPLTPPLGTNEIHYSSSSVNKIVVHKINGRFMDIEDTETMNEGEHKQVLNFATFDFLGMSADTVPSNYDLGEKIQADKKSKKKSSPSSPTSTATESLATTLHPVKEASLAALDRYGCGSCGPRGFYGTVDVHLDLEKSVADFTKTDDAILYSDGASTVSSTIAAFCKRGDILIVDSAVYEPIRTGVQLSRAHVKWFAHNDMADLRRILMSVQSADKKLGRALNKQRRFIVVEGLYKNTGSICPLDELIRLKHEFKYRLILDESFSFGTLGGTGRGVAELYNQTLMYDVEISTVSLENAMGSIGGLTVGTEEVVDHQRLAGSGYCFSASTPPFTATAAMAALDLLRKRPDVTLKRLHENCAYLHEKLPVLLHQKLEDLLMITSDTRSPIVMLQVADIPETEYLDDVVFLQEVVRESLARDVAFVATGAMEQQQRPSDPPPSIRMTISAAHTKADIDKALLVLGEAVEVVMSRFHDEAPL